MSHRHILYEETRPVTGCHFPFTSVDRGSMMFQSGRRLKQVMRRVHQSGRLHKARENDLKSRILARMMCGENFWWRENDSCWRGWGGKTLVGTSKRKRGGLWLDQEGNGSSFHPNEVTEFLLQLLFRPIRANNPSIASGFGYVCVRSPLVKGFPVANNIQSRWEKGTIHLCWYLERPSGTSLTTHSPSVIRFDLLKCWSKHT